MSINKIILIGNVGKDPVIKHMDNNMTVANFSIATSEKAYKSKSGKEIPERTDWHNIIVWGALANVIEKYVKSGTQLYIEGKIRNRSYDHTDGTKRYVTEVYADSFQLLGNKPSTSNPEPINEAVHNSEPQPEDDLPF